MVHGTVLYVAGCSFGLLSPQPGGQSCVGNKLYLDA